MTTTGIPHVVVVGGGLAGLSAAVACVDAGVRVTLLESKPRLGGATWSFERNGLAFDNGQHVFLRCCSAYRGFLDRIGTTGLATLQSRLSIPVISPTRPGRARRVAWIERDALPAPLHLARSLLSYKHLALRDRVNAIRAFVALKKLNLDDPLLDEESFGAFLARHGQREKAIGLLFGLITLPTVNCSVDDASLALAAKVFKTGLLEHADAGDLGWANVPLRELHVDPAVQVLEKAGAAVRRRAKVSSIALGSNSCASGVVVDGEALDADAVVLAVPHDAAARLLPTGGRIDPASLFGLGSSPIIDVHVVYDRRVSEFEVAAGVDTPVQFVFDRTHAAGLDRSKGQCLAVSVSAADDEHGERPEALIDRYTEALVQLFPAAKNARVVDAVVSREHEATFRGVPGTGRLRIGVESGFARLYVAGAWTDTGWPATMEGAVRSGRLAAAHALRAVDVTRNVPVVEEVVA